MEQINGFGRRLKEIMQAHGYTLGLIQRRRGVSTAAVSGYYTGRNSPTINSLNLLVSPLKISLDWLVYGEGYVYRTEGDIEYDIDVFPTRLANAMNDKRYTVDGLSDDSGVSDSSIKGYLEGENLPSITAITKLSKCLGVSVDYLLGKTIKSRK
ncbi:transcriptional regulator with XRE-family HTH domain [Lachnospiraceae bacterium PFB1-21]